MASPVYTTGTAANALASQNLALSSSVSFIVTENTVFQTLLQFGVTFGTVAATAGVTATVYRRIGATPTVDTNGVLVDIIPAVVNTTQYSSIPLDTGSYTITLTNLDATNAVTVEVTSDTVSSVA